MTAETGKQALEKQKENEGSEQHAARKMRINARLHRLRNQMRTGNRQQKPRRKGRNKIAATRKDAKRQNSGKPHGQHTAQQIGKNNKKKRGHREALCPQEASIVEKRFQDVTEVVSQFDLRSERPIGSPRSKVLNFNQRFPAAFPGAP